MKCTKCGADTFYYYMAGPVILCEDCACNSVAALADEGLFPFFDKVITVTPEDCVTAETTNEAPTPAECAEEKAVLSSVYGVMEGKNADTTPEGRVPYPDTYSALDEENS